MLKNLSKIFPFKDHLYVFQLMEYNSGSLLRWFMRNPWRRNIQKKHRLNWTVKARVILFVSLSFLLAEALLVAYLLKNVMYVIPIFIILSQVFPVYLIVAKLLLMPLDTYKKNKIVSSAKKKIDRLENLKVVAITGSFGKTSTKDILYALLWKKYRVVKTLTSFNTKLGVSQTILEDIKENTDIFISEVGAYKRGEIAEIVRIIEPKIGIITALGPQHLERFGSLDNIVQAKFELIEGLDSRAMGILNKNYKELVSLANGAKCKMLFYGSSDSDFRASDIKVTLNGTSFLISTPKGTTDMHIPLIGEHHVYNFLAAAAAALELGLSLDEVKDRATKLLPTPHRLEVTKNGKYTLIDNSFNSNLESARSSFRLFASLDAPRKIIITPGLVELGRIAEVVNKDFIAAASKVADEIIIVGQSNKNYLEDGLKEAKFAPKAVHFADSTQKALILANEIAKKGSLVLIENDLPDQYR
ncbi:MAG: UDP-N-acetylmuramoyl-tripeptide-D-alanyl-D-alanine ligase [Candidatus Levybacteria bacterium GW2011_GWC2_40_7]|nr:MAG: UDP-N-acetylmuramoyl-tripeptide-D-alanyl-D-alanine ligase [Candidatus Levybacteria bacterium GW2011_GWC2_40_7]